MPDAVGRAIHRHVEYWLGSRSGVRMRQHAAPQLKYSITGSLTIFGAHNIKLLLVEGLSDHIAGDSGGVGDLSNSMGPVVYPGNRSPCASSGFVELHAQHLRTPLILSQLRLLTSQRACESQGALNLGFMHSMQSAC